MLCYHLRHREACAVCVSVDVFGLDGIIIAQPVFATEYLPCQCMKISAIALLAIAPFKYMTIQPERDEFPVGNVTVRYLSNIQQRRNNLSPPQFAKRNKAKLRTSLQRTG
jgi:hypothetical protein